MTKLEIRLDQDSTCQPNSSTISQPSVDSISCSIRSVVRIASEKVIKLCRFLMQGHSKVELSHRELILIRKKYAFCCEMVQGYHNYHSQSSISARDLVRLCSDHCTM